MYAPPQASSEPAYQPNYATGQPSRQRLITILAASALSAVGLATAMTWLGSWYVYPIMLIALPTSALAWYISADELSVIRRGGVDVSHRMLARLGLVLGIFCCLLAIGLIYAAIQQGIVLGE